MSNRHLFTTLLLLAGIAVAGRTVIAHHAFGAEFDPNAPIKLQGKVVRLEWVNPHTWIHIEVVRDGKPEVWMVEGGTPNTLLRRGITRDTVAVGTEIIVDGYQTKDHSLKRANGRLVRHRRPARRQRSHRGRVEAGSEKTGRSVTISDGRSQIADQLQKVDLESSILCDLRSEI